MSFDSPMPLSLKVALVLIVLSAGVYDLRFRRIPNWISFSGIVLGVGGNTLLFGSHGLGKAALGVLCAAGIYLPLYLVRGMGAGDVKLMAAVGSLAGPQDWLEIFVATAIIGGIVSLVVVASKGRLAQTLGNVGLIASQLLQLRLPSRVDTRLDVRHRDSIRLPHGAAIASGCMVYLIFNAGR